MTDEANDTALLFALCHEMGNLVGALRLQTHLLDHEMSPRDLVTARSEIDVLGARISALLALVHPLQAPKLPDAADAIDPDDVVSVVEHGLEPLVLPGVTLDFTRDGGGHRMRVDRNALQAIVSSFAHLAVEQVRPSGCVRVAVEPAGEGVALVVEDDGPIDHSLESWADESLRGRTLLCALTAHVLSHGEGELHVSTSKSGSRVEIRLPEAGSAAPC